MSEIDNLPMATEADLNLELLSISELEGEILDLITYRIPSLWSHTIRATMTTHEFMDHRDALCTQR